MKLIVILVSLALERFVGVGAMLSRFSWFDAYVGMVRKSLGPTAKGMVGALILIAAIPIVVMFISMLFAGVIGLVIALAVFLYCLGPVDLRGQVEKYAAAKSKQDPDAAKAEAKGIIGSEPSSDEAQCSRDITVAIFQQFNDRLFGVLFWFVILGPMGAVLYRVTSLLRKKAEQSEDLADMAQSAALIHNLLDWVPVRLQGLSYAIMSHFGAVSSYLFENILAGLNEGPKLLKNYGLIALGVDRESKAGANLEENQKALDMAERTLVVILGIVLVFTLFAFVL